VDIAQVSRNSSSEGLGNISASDDVISGSSEIHLFFYKFALDSSGFRHYSARSFDKKT